MFYRKYVCLPLLLLAATHVYAMYMHASSFVVPSLQTGAMTAPPSMDHLCRISPPTALLEPATSPHTAVNRLAALQAWARDMQPTLTHTQAHLGTQCAPL